MKSRLIEDGFEIGGIPTVVVDPHHHVLPTWFEYFDEQPVKLVHIDRHEDMARPWLLSVSEPPRGVDQLDQYVKSLWEGCFILPAVYLGLLDSIYWFSAREPLIGEYMKPYSPEQPQQLGSAHSHTLEWTYDGTIFRGALLKPRNMFVDMAVYELLVSDKPMLLDIDLDAFECCQKGSDDEDLSEVAYRKRFETAFKFIERIGRPDLITIAKSQTPNTYVDPRKVNRFLRDTIDGLAKLYEK